jgi:hypothetical protein
MQILTVTALDPKTTVDNKSTDFSTISNNVQIQTVTSPLSRYVNCATIVGFSILKTQLYFILQKRTFRTAQRTYCLRCNHK